MAAKKNVPENFHALYDLPTRASRGAALTARSAAHPGIERLQNDRAAVTIHLDEGTQNPVSVQASAGEALSEPTSSADAAAKGFVRDRGDLWNLESGDANTLEVEGVSTKGLPTVRMVQRVDGVEVFQGELRAAIDVNHRVLSVVGQAFAGAASSSARRSLARAKPKLGAEAAVAKAASDLLGDNYTAADFESVAPPRATDTYNYFSFRRTTNDQRTFFDRPARVKDVLFPLGAEQFVQAYYIELWPHDFPAFSYVVEADDTPDVLFRKNLTSHVKFSYRVHNTNDALLRPEDGPAPGTPHPTGVPDGFQAPTIAEKLIQVESLLPGDPWLTVGATATDGNNCFAYADLKAPNGFGAGDVPGKTSAPGIFDYTYDHTKDATDSNNLQASLVGMFFHVNWLHDRWYEAGFDEASGNAQKDNFGRGGFDGDPILAEGADFSGTDNANMSTPADGASPRMQMFTFKGVNPLPSRTSNHEALITFHEMGHYITNRLVGNASGLGNVQGGSMGEGWGDFFAICMTSQAHDNFENGVFAAGGWTDLTPTFKNNYYFSIRRYPYTADMTKNPLTFKHIAANVVLPAGAPRNPQAGGPNNEEHNAGEIWCAMLWEVFVALVAAHGHADAENRVLRYVIGGLKQTPSQPTFTQARDGILLAVAALDANDLPLVKAAFAKRGMGRNAVSPPANSTALTGVVEDFNP